MVLPRLLRLPLGLRASLLLLATAARLLRPVVWLMRWALVPAALIWCWFVDGRPAALLLLLWRPFCLALSLTLALLSLGRLVQDLLSAWLSRAGLVQALWGLVRVWGAIGRRALGLM